MKFIIETIELTDENQTIIKALKLINMMKITINGEQKEMKELPKEEYEQVDAIIEGHRKYLKFRRQIVRMQTIMKKEEDNKHPELLKIKPNEFYSETAMEEIKRQMTCSERTKYKLYSFDNNYCLFLASMHFETIDDFINLELVTPRAKNNMSKFFYNPISLNEKTRPFFDHLQTLYIYDRTKKIMNLKKMRKLSKENISLKLET